MITLRPAGERGHANHGWLDTHHTFSFADYYDPRHDGFRNLRVINEDRVAPGAGFGRHGHRDMEIISYVLEGALRHEDSMGTGSTIVPGDVQRMSAGTGVMHSEANASRSELVHFLQIWIIPSKRNITPGYEQKTFSKEDKRARLRLLASPDGADGSITIHADARLFGTVLSDGDEVAHKFAARRHGWIHVARGSVQLGKHTLRAGDGAALSDEESVTLKGVEKDAEVLLFDLG